MRCAGSARVSPEKIPFVSLSHRPIFSSHLRFKRHKVDPRSALFPCENSERFSLALWNNPTPTAISLSLSPFKAHPEVPEQRTELVSRPHHIGWILLQDSGEERRQGDLPPSLLLGCCTYIHLHRVGGGAAIIRLPQWKRLPWTIFKC